MFRQETLVTSAFDYLMGTRERQEREREIVRRAIVDAARELFVAEGYGKVSMRKIAERIEYSPAAIYSYFPSKDDIFYALAEEGFRLLCDGLPDKEETDPLIFIRRALNGLYRFSQAHPEYYALMFLDRAVPTLKGAAERIPLFAEMVKRMRNTMRRCIDEGIFPGATDPIAVFDVLKTAVHGAATATVCGRLRPGRRATRWRTTSSKSPSPGCDPACRSVSSTRAVSKSLRRRSQWPPPERSRSSRNRHRRLFILDRPRKSRFLVLLG